MPKISIIGAGSFFTNMWIKHILLAPGLKEGTFAFLALVDIDPKRVELTHRMAEKMVSELGGDWIVKSRTEHCRTQRIG